MVANPPERSARRPLDAAALAHQIQRLQAAPSAPWLHGEVARRMALRLPVIRLQPERIVDWWAHTGGSAKVLAQTYRAAHITAVEPAAALRARLPARPAPWWRLDRWARADAALPDDAVPAGSAQLLWSNMALHAAIDPQAVMAQWQRVLAVDGFVMFSTLGPGSLQGLRENYAAAGWPMPHAPFVDMHDLGDMLIEAGFADPVMDQETITLTWASGPALLEELRGLGGNVDPRRTAGLRTPRWRRQLCDKLEAGSGADGRIALAFEVVYGHAFRPAPRPRLAAHTELPLDDMRAMVRSGRPQR
jgi:malonyl-CoA O-methyltransferase